MERTAAARPRRPGSCRSALLDGDERHVLRLGALRAVGGLELHLRALGERLVALADYRAVVDEHVLAAFVGGDEPVPLVGVEPLDGSGCHRKNTSSTAQERAEEARRAHPVLAQSYPQGTRPSVGLSTGGGDRPSRRSGVRSAGRRSMRGTAAAASRSADSSSGAYTAV